MAQEDDLRALGKIMDFLRAVSIILAIMNVYWYCYEAMHIWGVTIGVVDRILINFNRTGGLFHSILYTKLFSLLLLALSCLGTKSVKAEKMSWNRIWTVLAVGFFLFFLNWWILLLPISYLGNATLYIFTMTAGYICLLMGGLWMSRLLKEREFHAGDQTHGERVFRQSANTILLQEEMAERMDQRGQSVPSDHRVRYTG